MGCGNAKPGICESYGCDPTSIPSSSSLYDTGSQLSSGYITKEPTGLLAEHQRNEKFIKIQLQNRPLVFEEGSGLDEDDFYFSTAAKEKLEKRISDWVKNINPNGVKSHPTTSSNTSTTNISGGADLRDIFEVFDPESPLPDAVCFPLPFPKQRLRCAKHLFIVESQLIDC
eukprot:TRINITY_DN366_c1_g1_i1.p1 TRINITY_DN366_c1_g1~~TRINITY_DN366_c1_g1_i1.p1  ORF type:complete len:171 (+),score=31.02 TRINITY_DN366_c1_g1_i1:53-565(+)